MTDNSEDVYYWVFSRYAKNECAGIFGDSDEERESMRKTIHDLCASEERRGHSLSKEDIDLGIKSAFDQFDGDDDDARVYGPKKDKTGQFLFAIHRARNRGEGVADALRQQDPPTIYQYKTFLAEELKNKDESLFSPDLSQVEQRNKIGPYITPVSGNYLVGVDWATFTSKRDAREHASKETFKRTKELSGKGFRLGLWTEFWIGIVTRTDPLEGRDYWLEMFVVSEWKRDKTCGKWIQTDIREITPRHVEKELDCNGGGDSPSEDSSSEGPSLVDSLPQD
ncbi:uncharacterized protein J4E79_011706 [Alternaria viburni]|uniref:uncharacterized protein n=1 Tax=Alternaria viburni TaxID=566460 RepID=UPI0020C225F8|nr:uncharacterized protein J4E79_011706 [Alternaria viburni]KAI4641314.1 hypothetical protein J4E79_011706 [Alternaria viburni]